MPVAFGSIRNPGGRLPTTGWDASAMSTTGITPLPYQTKTTFPLAQMGRYTRVAPPLEYAGR